MTKWILGGLLLLLAILVGTLLYLHKNKPKPETTTNTAVVPNNTPTVPNTNPTILQRGSTGADVTRLQTTINQGISFYKANPSIFQLVYPGKTIPALLAIDGQFGQNTENALFLFTGKRSITVLELNALVTQINATTHA